MKVLFITPRIPLKNGQGDQVISYYRLKYLAAQYEIVLISYVWNKKDVITVQSLKPYCKEIYLIKKNRILSFFYAMMGFFIPNIPFQVLYYFSFQMKRKIKMLSRTQQFDIYHVFLLRMSYLIKSLKGQKIVDFVDSMVLNFSRRANLENGFKKILLKQELNRLKKFELTIMNHFNVGIVVSKIDKDFFNSKKVVVIPLGVPIDSIPKVRNEKPIIIFTGNMFYFPNEDACTWFINKCYQRIQQNIDNVEFWIVGRRPSRKIMNFSNIKGIKVKGEVTSISEQIKSARIAIAPMQSGSGMQNKILESMACGIPVVATSIARGSITAKHGYDILIADNPEEFSDNCINLLRNDVLTEQIGSFGFNLVKNYYNWEYVSKEVYEIYNMFVRDEK